MSRTFEARKAVRERVPMIVGLVGPSGSGKTYSALRLATGMREVTGGEIFFIDTEARRALHYADDFDFQHVEMGAPFSPLDYLEAIQFCKAKGAKIVIIDSLSHEHDGPGGVLEMHDAELDKMAGKTDFAKRNKMTFSAWAKPKAQRRRLINEILRMGINAVFCFRAKEKIKLVRGKDPVSMGWQPIAGDDYVYESTISCLLYPNCGGVPNWAPDESAEKMMLKRPEHLASVFQAGLPLSEGTGRGLAEWAQGNVDRTLIDEVLTHLGNAPDAEELDRAAKKWAERDWSDSEKAELRAAVVARRKALKTETPSADVPREEPGADPNQGLVNDPPSDEDQDEIDRKFYGEGES